MKWISAVTEEIWLLLFWRNDIIQKMYLNDNKFKINCISISKKCCRKTAKEEWKFGYIYLSVKCQFNR